jgi:hypothetical protein
MRETRSFGSVSGDGRKVLAYSETQAVYIEQIAS